MYFNYVQHSLVILLFYRNAVETFQIIENSRMLNGIPAESHIPYQVVLYMSKPGRKTFCSGSIITTKFVLTAAHCLVNATSVEVVFKVHSLAKATSKRTDSMQSDKIRLHENWNSLRPLLNNIALVELPNKIKLSETLKPVLLANKWSGRLTYVGKNTKISGWGADTTDVPPVISDVIRILNIQMVIQGQCANRHVMASNLCGFGKGGGNACIGDDGGPLVVEDNGTITQIGIILYETTTPFCLEGLPHIFTRVSWFLNWIQQNSNYNSRTGKRIHKCLKQDFT